MTARPEGVAAGGSQLRRMLGLPPGPPSILSGICLDSRRVRPGDLYAALPGFTTHGAAYLGQAVAAGAAAVLTDPTGAELIARSGPAPVPVLVVDDPRGRLGELAAWLYGHPSRLLRTTGITGTNGKTTTSYLLDSALRAGGMSTGLIGTVAVRIGDEELPSARTTPEAPDLHALLAVLVQRGAGAVTLEVSSHALALGRVDGVRFDLAVFTNLSQDHLDFHHTLEQYFATKAELFTQARARAALICLDDEWGERLAARAVAAGLPTVTYGLNPEASWSAGELAQHEGGTRFVLAGPGGVRLDASVAIPGRFNVANAVAAVAAAVHHGIPAATAVAGVASSRGVPGRMEWVGVVGGVGGIVDYAHTPDAVERAIAAARTAATGRVIVVMGCGGDRDADKRPIMGEVAARAADVLVVTDDNPRSEPPAAIRQAIMGGVARVDPSQRAELHEQEGRRQAIELGVRLSGEGDLVLVLGKGHEQGQEARGVTTPFDDRVELASAMGALR